MPDDAELLRLYLEERSEAAFGDLVRRHLNLVYFAALRQVNGDTHCAEDVTQSVFTKLVAKAPALRARPSLAGWLYLTTRFEAAHALRTERRRQTREQEAQAMHDILSDSEPVTDWNRLRSVVDEILPALGDRDRELVLLRFFQGISFPEIGKRTGLSSDAVRFRLDRAFDKVRTNLAKRGVHTTAEALALAFAGQAEAAAPAGLAVAVIGTALASAKTAGAGAAGFLQIMSISKLVMGTAVLVGLLGLGYSVHENALVRETTAALAAENRDYDASLAQLRELRKEVQRAKQAAAMLPDIAAGTDAASEGHPGSPSSTKEAKAGPTSPADRAAPVINRELNNNPEVRAALAGWIGGSFNVLYGPFFKSAALSPAQIGALDNLMLQHNIDMGAAWLTLRPEGVTQDQVDQSIHTLLGDAIYKEFNQYQRTVYVREVASGLAGNLYDTATPLTSQQADQLTQVLGQNGSSSAPNGVPFPGTVKWEPVLTQAQGFLSAPQLAVLRNIATVLAAQSGPGAGASLWAGLNPISPGSIGNTPTPPAAFYAPPGSLK